MTLDALLEELSNRGVKVSADEGHLRIRAPKGAIDAALQEELRLHKTAILQWLNGPPSDARIAPVPRAQPLVASFMQERLWFLSQMHPDGVAYNLPNGRLLTGALNIQALRQALERIVARHESLRTTFRHQDGRCLQVIHPSMDLDFQFEDLRQEPNPRQTVDERAEREANHRFDLEHGPLFRVRTMHMDDRRYMFVWTLHHIISDGWSSMLFLRELKALYEEYTGGAPAQLPELSIQYADFAHWERQQLDSTELDAQLAHWTTHLNGQLPVLDIATDRPRPPIFTYRGRCYPFSLDQALSDDLKTLARRCNTTLYTVLLSAFTVLLFRLSGQTDLCVGSPVARRNRPDIENLLGCFINALVLRTDLRGDPTFAELVDRVRETCAGAFRHQDVPFEKLVEVLTPTRDASHTPFFQAMFILHVQDKKKISQLGDLAVEAVEYHTRGSKLDITLEIKETEQGLEGWVEYNTDVFTEARMREIMAQFTCLLRHVSAEPETTISATRLMDDAQRQRALQTWNRTGTTFSHEATIHDLLSRQAQSRPDARALVCGDGTLTYGELETQSNHIAQYLRTQDIGRNSLVGLHLRRSLRLVPAILGVLKSGAAYVPLDPTFPQARLAHMTRDSELSFIITERALAESAPGDGIPTLSLDEQWADVLEYSAAPIADQGHPTDLAYIIYTSGSTGVPKGVEIEHRSVVNFVEAMAQRPGIHPRDTLLAITTLSFDIAVLELFVPLMVGACVRLATSNESKDGQALRTILDSGEITVMQATPATWKMLLESGWRGDDRLRALCGGESLSAELAHRLAGMCGELWNMYGPTETTVWSMVERVTADQAMISVGRPIANTQVYLVDEHHNLAPVGVQGELCIAGAGLARGYRHQPDMTRERFVPNPFADSAQPEGSASAPVRDSLMYRTGDVGRYLPDGRVELLGRIDNQVKVRGFRIELGEVGAVLEDHPFAAQAVAHTFTDNGDVHLVGYIVPQRSGDDLPLASLRQHLESRLPQYMVPTRWVALDALPLTPNQKVDRKALPPPERSHLDATHPIVEPRTPQERTVAAIWADVLGVNHIGVHQTFFDLGGHSLLAMKLVTMLRERTGVAISLVSLFQGSTVADIATLIQGEEEPATAETPAWGVVALRPSGARTPFFAVGSHPRYVEVANHIDADRPVYKLDVYALQAERQRAGRGVYRTIEEIAHEFTASIRRIQPHGPYVIGGGCEGAMVALEIALNLQRAGETIAILSPWVMVAPGAWTQSVYHRPSWKRVLDQVRSVTANIRAHRLNMKEIGEIVRHEYLEYRIFRAVDIYQPKELINAPVLFVRTTEDAHPDERDRKLGWQAMTTQRVDVCALPGTHATWLSQHADQLGHTLNDHLKQLDPRAIDAPTASRQPA